MQVAPGRSRILVPPRRPFLAFVTHYFVAIISIFAVHDAFFNHDSIDLENRDITRRQDRVAGLTFVYVSILFTARYLSSFFAGSIRQHAVLYELTWMCNSTLVMGFICFGGLGNILHYVDENKKHQFMEWICRRRPLVVTACCVGVSIDQVLWYVDLFGRACTGKFLIGVAKYLTWKQTLWIDKLTCTHHLWTIPLFIYGAGCELNYNSYVLSSYVVTVQVLLSRWLTPHHIQIESKLSHQNFQSDPTKYRYLNVNLSHELWRDISFTFLQISKDSPSCSIYLFRLLWRWQLLNWVVFVVVLLPLSVSVRGIM